MADHGLAIFDLDGTLTAGGSLERHFMRYVWWQGRIPWRNLLLSACFFLRHVWRDPVTAVKRNKLYLRGMTLAEAVNIARQFVAERGSDVLTPERQRLVAAHVRSAERVVLLTGSPRFLVDALLKGTGLHFDQVYTTSLAVESGRLTGLIEPPHYYGAAKEELVSTFPSLLGVDLSRSSCYADSGSDIPMLLLCGRPVAVDPDPVLLREARKRGWEIITF